MQIATRVLAAQVSTGLCAAALWGLRSREAAFAALVGASAALLPGLYLAWRLALARRISREPRDLVVSVYRGTVGKFLLSAVLLGAAVSIFPQNFLPVLTALIACMAVYWIVLLVPDNEGTTTNDGERTR